MDNPTITIKEYIRLEEEKAHRRDKVYNWETATYGKICYDDDIYDLRSAKTEFPAIIFNDELTPEKALSCEPMVSSLNNNKIDFRISFDESDYEDYTIWHHYHQEIRGTRGLGTKSRGTLRISCITTSRDLRRYLAGLHIAEEMAEDGFEAYWLGIERVIPIRGIFEIIGLRFH
nr:hypothetical protein [Tanacetum cinerariifolium]